MNVQRLVFRLKEIPYSVNTSEEVAQFLANALVDVDPTDIVVQSLATSLNSWTKPSDRSTKVATLMFKRTPRLLDDEPIDGGWCIDPDGSSLCLDTNFLGLTPLNDVEPSIHVGDCVAISGLSSHPFGSWQPKGSDKKFMWIRDCLPRKLPLVRVILYGQDSRLEKSGSFQQLDDMARDLLQSIRQLDKAKRLIFLGHSLGGLILKEAIVQLKTSPDGNDYRILKRIEGAVCFGVPNLGMEQNHFLAVTKGARNEVLIRDIEKTSNYIAKLDRMYTDDDDLRTLRFIWAYETLESCTTIVSVY
ncbi:hypothetical protein F4805DRAFT_469921 [Annulohypoxylon moriforme]|nr:hypothetical protein F4805DRAFT_469921 [Annulohypoxylon moriforme]